MLLREVVPFMVKTHPPVRNWVAQADCQDGRREAKPAGDAEPERGRARGIDAAAAGTRPTASLARVTRSIIPIRIANIPTTERYAKFGPDHLSGAIRAIDTYFADFWSVGWRRRRRSSSNGVAYVLRASGYSEIGGANRDRTGDLYNAIVALSQLSYGPNLAHPRPAVDRLCPDETLPCSPQNMNRRARRQWENRRNSPPAGLAAGAGFTLDGMTRTGLRAPRPRHCR